MQCAELLFSDHAIAQLFRRDIEVSDIRHIIQHGESINEYPDDKPYPSFLLLGFIKSRPIHVVVAKSAEHKRCIVVTAYEPDRLLWAADFKTKKK